MLGVDHVCEKLDKCCWYIINLKILGITMTKINYNIRFLILTIEHCR